MLGFVAAHGLVAAGSGFALGVGLAYLLADAFGFEGIGIATSPVIDPVVIIRAAGLGAIILVAATTVAAMASLRMRPAQALRDE